MFVFTKWCKKLRRTWPLIVKNSYDQSWIPRRLTHSMMDNGWWWWMMVLWWWWVVGEVWERWCAKGWVEMAPSTPIYRLNRSLGTAPWWAIEASIGLSFLLLLGHGPVLAEHGACSVFCLLYFSWEDAVEGSGVTPLFPRVSPVGPVGDYRDVVGNNIVKPHNIYECTAEA